MPPDGLSAPELPAEEDEEETTEDLRSFCRR